MLRAKGSPDTEGGFSDVDERFQAYAEAIACLIDDPDTTTPLTIAIHAPWGAGKSALAHRIFRLLREKPSASGRFPHVTCWFNAWMHDDADNIATALVSHVAQSADRMRPWWRRFRSPLPVSLAPPGEQLKRRLAVAVVTILLALALSRVLVVVLPLKTLAEYVAKDILGLEMSSPDATRAVGTSGLGNHGSEFTFVLITLALAVARRFAEIGRGLSGFVKDPQGTASAGSVDRVKQQLGAILQQATPAGSRFILFIDEVDLCRPPHCIDILETLSQLLGHPRIVTVVVADVSAIAAHAEIKYEKLACKYVPGVKGRTQATGVPGAGYGRIYLQKFIQVQFNLPSESTRSFINGSLFRATQQHRESESGDLEARWRTLYRETLYPLSRPIQLAQAFHRPLPDEAEAGVEHHVRAHSRPAVMPWGETFLGPMTRLWDLPPAPRMLLVGLWFLALLPVRGVIFVAARAAYQTELRPFPVQRGRNWEQRIAGALAIALSTSVVSDVASSAVGLRNRIPPNDVICAVAAALVGWIIVVLNRIHRRDRERLNMIREALAATGGKAAPEPMPEESALRPGVYDVLRRERERLDAVHGSEILAEALDEALSRLPPLPRLAKRVALQLRIQVDVLQMLGVLRQDSCKVTSRHLGKWAALQELWPVLGSAVRHEPWWLRDLETAAAATDASVLRGVLPAGLPDDEDLRDFLTSEPRLGAVAPVLVSLAAHGEEETRWGRPAMRAATVHDSS